MLTDTTLNTAVLSLRREQAVLDALLEEITVAACLGLPDRIADAALAAQQQGDQLTHSLSRVFSTAAEVSARLFDDAVK